MAEYNKIYSFQIEEKLREGKDVYLLDRQAKRVFFAKDIALETYIEVLSNKDNRFEAWVEESEEENED